jgi:hypothetical protein
MANALISIGGTGAKVIEAISHLAAMGLFSNEIKIILCDPDRSNGNLQKTQETLNNYSEIKKSLRYFKNSEIFSADLEIFTASGDTESTKSEQVWTPLLDPKLKKLDDIFVGMSRESKRLYDLLFSEDEKRLPLNFGFRGHPALGATVLSKALLDEEDPFWNKFFEELAESSLSSGEFKVFIVGSIFGGTGASGFPTIATKIHDKLKDKKGFILGGLLLLPYFKFDKPVNKEEIDKFFEEIKDDDPEDPLLFTDSNEFERVAKTAIEYYDIKEYSDKFKSFYLLGDNKKKKHQFSPGAGGQTNDANILEAFAGLAASDFYSSVNYPEKENFRLFAREDDNSITWKDVNINNFKKRMKQFIRFSILYLYVIDYEINTLKNTKNPFKKKSILPFWVDFFLKENEKNSDERENLRKYCMKYLKWVCEINEHSEYIDGINLVNIPRLWKEDKEKIGVPDKKFHVKILDDLFCGGSDENISFRNIWDRINNIKTSDSDINKEDIFWSFINRVFAECE